MPSSSVTPLDGGEHIEVAMDGPSYTERVHSRVRWKGCRGSVPSVRTRTEDRLLH